MWKVGPRPNLRSGSKLWTIAMNQLVSLQLQITPWPLLSGGLSRIDKPSILFRKHIQEWTNYPYDRVAILRTRHLVEKLSKQPHVGKLIQYHQCLPHFMEMEQIRKYLQRQQITYTNEGVKSFDNEIDDFFIPAQLILYAQVGCLRNQEPIIRFFCNVKLECMCSFVGTLQH